MSEIDGKINDPAECEHKWEAVSMVFETQLLDPQGRVAIRQPDPKTGRVYLVCLACASHTYMSTSWIRYRLHGSEDAFEKTTSPYTTPQRTSFEPPNE